MEGRDVMFKITSIIHAYFPTVNHCLAAATHYIRGKQKKQTSKTVTAEFADDLDSGLGERKPTVPCLTTAAVFQLKIHWAQMQSFFVP